MDKRRDIPLSETSPHRWENRPTRRGQHSHPLRIFASFSQLQKAREEGCLEQVSNVAQLPGLLGPALAMPDIHSGYGFCIGGVAAFDQSEGIVTPGGVGYDINCGVSLISTALSRQALSPHDLAHLGQGLFDRIPSGLHPSAQPALTETELDEVLLGGAAAVVKRHGTPNRALERIERCGHLPVTDPESVSAQARQRGRTQLGSLGSGNHFVEVQVLSEILHPEHASALGLKAGTISLLLHTGSRGLGHQVASDYIALFQRQKGAKRDTLPDPQLCYARLGTALARRYLEAHNAAANFAWANRHLIVNQAIETMAERLGLSIRELSAELVSDHSHNLASWEADAGDSPKRLVHRKGATRALPPGHPELLPPFRQTGQAVILPGSMGSSSYLLCGHPDSETAWHSCPHGAGRYLSRRAAIKLSQELKLVERLRSRDILLYSHSREGLAEEVPEAYKPIDEVLKVTVESGLAIPVARFDPLLVIKG